MENYEKMYFMLFNKITDALAELEKCNYGNVAELLQTAQRGAEEVFLKTKEQ